MPNAATDTLGRIFEGSIRQLSQEAGSGFVPSVYDAWTGNCTFTIAAILSVLIILIFTADFINILPSVIGSFTRWKECVNLYNSVSIRRSRDKVFVMTIIPAILLVARNSLFPAFLGVSPGQCIMSTILMIGSYLLLRYICRLLFKGKSISRSDFNCACSPGKTFFISAVVLTVPSAWLLRSFGVDKDLIQTILLWEIASVYFIFLIRKTQIFVSQRGILAGISYLCTLEFLPTGLLVGAAFIL